MQKARVFGANIAEMQLDLKDDFDAANDVLIGAVRGFNGQTMLVAQSVARANGVTTPAVPYPKPDHHLEPQEVYVGFFVKLLMVEDGEYDKAYYVRKWGPGKVNVQPDHEVTWGVCKYGIIGTATARSEKVGGYSAQDHSSPSRARSKWLWSP